MKRRTCIIFLSILTACILQAGQGVIRYARHADPLEQRWQWALAEGARQQGLKGYCIVYSIQKLMNENSYMSSGSFFSGSVHTSTSLYEIIGEQHPDTSVSKAAQKAIARIKSKEQVGHQSDERPRNHC